MLLLNLFATIHIYMLKYIVQFYLTIAIPLFYLLILFIIKSSIGTFSISYQIRIIGVVFALCGLLLWIISYINLGRAFGVLPKKQKKIRHGLYQYLSHPMYIGISATFLGLSITLRSYPGFLITVIFLIPLLCIRAILEEKTLKK